MPKTGISLHIGLNYLDPDHYNGWDGKLNACEFDAQDMESLAASKGFKTKLLLREFATRKNVIDNIKKASNKLKSGDIFYISYSGHGGQVPDFDGDEDDQQDETWCLYDGQLIDDELKNLWRQFNSGVRILVTSDSCHSGSVIKAAKRRVEKSAELTPKFMPDEIAATTYFKNKKFYDDIAEEIKSQKKSTINATVKLISGCQDNQYSYDGTFNGQFTGALKRVWNGGTFRKVYKKFHSKIVHQLPDYQTPNYLTIGKSNNRFDNEVPFTI